MKRKIFSILFVLVLTLSFSLLGFGATSYAGGVTVTRTLPSSVIPGQTFDVMITFSAPADNFNSIGLSDFAPAGWSVAANNTWNTPNSDANNITGNRVDYIWDGPFANGTAFTAVYHVTVPANATPGTYVFTNSSPAPRLEYYVGEDGPFDDNIGGQNSVSIPATPLPASSSLSVGLMIAGLATLIMIFAFRRVRWSQG